RCLFLHCGVSRLRRIFSILSCTFRPCSPAAGGSQSNPDRDHGFARRPDRKLLQVLERHGCRSPGASGGLRYRPPRRRGTCNGGRRRRDKFSEGVVEARIPRPKYRSKTGNHAALSLDIPANVDPGSHWGALLAITAPAAQSNGAAVNVRTGVILLVHVLGQVQEKLVLESVTIPPFAESPPIPIEARFRNEGTVHEAPQG